MHPQIGSWSLGAADTSDIVFVSPTPASVQLTVTKTSGTDEVTVQVNNAGVANGTLGTTDSSRTFRLSGVGVISIVAGRSPVEGTVAGTYQLTILS
jgi:hypothetical protein